ncbi:MAG: Hpt domain-containing protein [Bacilli bacterium]|nr:Hpt domain-containing protein [Bacilli bacterium]MDE6141043.1 Hpt domain-containing protein [Bacilli bacterium]
MDTNLLTNNGIDINVGLELLGDMEMYNETLKDFINESSTRIPDIKKYYEEGDMPNYAILVHAMKSDSKYLGFSRLAELSYNHEMASKQEDREYVQANIEELLKEAERIIATVKEYLGLE